MRTSIRSLSNALPLRAAMASVFVLGTLTASAARADDTTNPTPKGIIGGAFLGAEVGTIVESIAGVHTGWVYALTDVVLGAGGAVGGWEVEQKSGDGRAPVLLLAGGLALAIPAIILTLNAVNTPASSASEDHAPLNQPPANPGAPGKSIVGPSGAITPTPESTVHLSLVDVKDGVHLGVPVPEVRQTFSANELRQYGLAQQTEVRMPLVKIAF